MKRVIRSSEYKYVDWPEFERWYNGLSEDEKDEVDEIAEELDYPVSYSECSDKQLTDLINEFNR